ncbi:hypothetical protein DYD21_13635 [Rhodohalobacter sp. SW132]|nr:hypothetical protein DYD21_13635 [Rhodohalobacter sp. SW132]
MDHPEENQPEKRVPLRSTRIIFVIVMLITCLAIIWPGHAIFSSATPLIFGFPLSFVWIILWVIIGFAAMMGLYLTDKHQDKV